MQEFDELKDLWQQGSVDQPSSAIPDVSKASGQTKKKLQNEQLKGAICLVLTACFIAGLAIWGGFGFEHWYTYGAMALVCVICLLQASSMFYTHLKIKQIDETANPKQHLSQWEAYYSYRKKLLKWNGPLYFVLLNLSLGIYFIEVMAMASATFMLVFGVVYTGWMIFAYFFLGKRVLEREQNRIEQIIGELKTIEMQFY